MGNAQFIRALVYLGWEVYKDELVGVLAQEGFKNPGDNENSDD